jgi:eukaryotic-like serine/threonine-protein kinase
MNYGRYVVVDEQDILGKGAMGVVYRAHDPSLNRQVAIKVLHRKLLHDDEALKGFLKEAALNASLSHPNILTILDIGEERGEAYIAMELLEGKPLSKVMATLSQKDILSISMQIADGLAYAHKKGVVHRDIKPANIMVLPDGQIKITDFGIAKGGSASGEEQLETQTGVIKGTPAYMSPEQARGDSKKVDGRSDLFSLGVLMYEMSVGKRPFGGDGKDFITVFGEVLNKIPQDPCQAKEAVDRDLSAAIMKSLQKDPARRFQSGSELFEVLKSCVKPETEPAQKSKRGALVGASAAGGVLVLAIGGFFLFHSGRNPVPSTSMVASPAPSLAPAPTPSPTPSPGASPTALPVAAPLASSVPSPAPSPRLSSQPSPRRPLPLPIVPVSHGAAPVLRPPAAQVPLIKEAAPKAAVKKVVGKAQAAPKNPAEPEPVKRQPSAPPQDSEAPGRSEAPPTQAPASQAPGAPASLAASSQFAFLKVSSSPAGAQVYLNGTLKGTTPLKLRLNFGRYKVRLSRPGFQDTTSSVTLDKMAEFPFMQELKPE